MMALNQSGEALMRRLVIVILLLVAPGTALAEQGPKPVNTETVRVPAPALMTLYAIDEETGVVPIDWKLAEDIVATKSIG
jgi:hypothetical protein